MQISNKLRKTVIRLTLICSVLLIGIAANPIQTSAQVKSDSVKKLTQPTPPANELQECSRLLDKTLNVLKECRDLADKRLTEVVELSADKKGLEGEIVEYVKLVKILEKRIKYLESIKCSKVSIFWVIRWKKCKI